MARVGQLVLAEGQRPRSLAGRSLEEKLRGIATGLRQQLDGVRDEKWDNQSARQRAAAQIVAAQHRRLDFLEAELSRLEEAWHAKESQVANVVHQVEARVTPVRMRVLERLADQLSRLPADEMQRTMQAAVAGKDEDIILASVIAGRPGAREALEQFCVGKEHAREARDLAGDHLALRQAHDALRLGLREMERDPASHLPANAFASPEERLSVLSGGLSAIVTIQSALATAARQQQEDQAAAKPATTASPEQQALADASVPETKAAG